MVRAFGAFLVVFSLLSLVVHLEILGSVFGMGALSFFAVDHLIVQFAKTSRPSRIPGEPLA
jgi:hypothetical protein